MKLFIYEYITSGALINQALPPSLEHEGNMMLTAIINDFLQLENIEITILRDNRITADINTDNPMLKTHLIKDQTDFTNCYKNAIAHTDFILPIAPETDNILLQIQQYALSQGKFLIGCQPSATATVSDKFQCYKTLVSFNISTPKTILASQWSLNKFVSESGYVTKPRYGAGSLNTQFFTDEMILTSWLDNQSQDLDQIIIQPYIDGKAISMSLLCSDSKAALLSTNIQYINLQKGKFTFNGCLINGINSSEPNFENANVLIDNIKKAIKGLWGFIGIDAVLTKNDISILEINPRLTTSYIGLHESIQINPALLLLSLIETGSLTLPTIAHRNSVEILL